MRRLSILVLLPVFLLPPCLLAGCRPATQPTHPNIAVPSSAPPATTPPPTATAPTDAAEAEATEARSIDEGPPGLLAAIRTQHYSDHDRVVFEFHGRHAPSPSINYVDRITMDPSDRPLSLMGRAFLTVAFHGATLDTSATEADPDDARRYTGPVRLTPRHPLLRELAVAGDFEAVLSFGIGLSAVAGLSTSTAANSGVVILDLWRTAPPTLVWPITTVTQARQMQHATQAGHQPWTLSAEQVASLFTEHVLNWRPAEVRQLSEHVFQAESDGKVAVVTLRQPLEGSTTVWAVASVIRTPQLGMRTSHT